MNFRVDAMGHTNTEPAKLRHRNNAGRSIRALEPFTPRQDDFGLNWEERSNEEPKKTDGVVRSRSRPSDTINLLRDFVPPLLPVEGEPMDCWGASSTPG